MNSILSNIKYLVWQDVDINLRYTYFHYINNSFMWRSRIVNLNLRCFNVIPSYSIITRK